MLLRGRTIGLLVMVALLAGLPGSASAQGDGRVLDQATIEVEGMQFIEMSPDGALLVAEHRDNKQLCVFTIEPLAEQACADLSALDGALRVMDLAWSPDSSRIVLGENGHLNFLDSDLWVLDAATGELSNLTQGEKDGTNPPQETSEEDIEFYMAISPAWTPDSATITFARSRYVDGDFDGTKIVSIPAVGGDVTELVPLDPSIRGLVDVPMHWTEDGEHLFYTVTYPDHNDGRNGIYRYSASSGAIDAIVPPSPESGPAMLLEVSPNGDAVLGLYLHDLVDYRSAALWLFDVETGELTRPNDSAIGQVEEPFDVSVTFSPDGGSILLGLRDAKDENSLWTISREDGEIELLVDDLPDMQSFVTGSSLSWAASGRIFVPTSDGNGMLLEVDSA